MKKITILALLLALVAAGATSFDYTGRFVRAVNVSIAADDQDKILLVKYYGSSTTATMEVAADGNLTFLQGGAASTEFECPVSGALGGIIDVSDAACNTNGEIVDIINASTSWRAYLLDGLRADTYDDNSALAAGATSAKGPDGLAVYRDVSTSFVSTRTLSACQSMSCLAPAGAIPTNPMINMYQVLNSINFKSTYGSGTSTINIYTRKRAKNAETTTLVWTEAGGATTAYNATGATDWPNGLISGPGEEFVINVTNSAAMATTLGQYNGMLFSMR